MKKIAHLIIATVVGMLALCSCGGGSKGPSALEAQSERIAGDLEALSQESPMFLAGTSAEYADYSVGNRSAFKVYPAHILFSLSGSLFNRFGNFLGLAHTVSDRTVAVADNYQSRKAHISAALNSLGYSVYLYELLDKAVVLFPLSGSVVSSCGFFFLFFHDHTP